MTAWARMLLIIGAGLSAGCHATTIAVQGQYHSGPGTVTITITR